MTRSIHIVLLSLLSAGALTFCAPQPANSATGQYVNCGQVAADVRLLVFALKVGRWNSVSDTAGNQADWYTRVVMAHAQAAVKTNNPTQYVRDLHKACLLETA